MPEVSKRATTPLLPFLKGHMRLDRNPKSIQEGIREGGAHSADGPQFRSTLPSFETQTWAPAFTPTCVLSLELDHQDADADSAPSFWTF